MVGRSHNSHQQTKDVCSWLKKKHVLAFFLINVSASCLSDSKGDLLSCLLWGFNRYEHSEMTDSKLHYAVQYWPYTSNYWIAQFETVNYGLYDKLALHSLPSPAEAVEFV